MSDSDRVWELEKRLGRLEARFTRLTSAFLVGGGVIAGLILRHQPAELAKLLRGLFP